MMAEKTYFAPGRVNLIGEHIDYNGGLVLPASITLGITAHYKKREDGRIVLRSATHALSKEFSIDDIPVYEAKNDWANYPIGVINRLNREGNFIPGCEITYTTTLPEGSALSSSAAIEVLTAYLILSQSQSKIDLVWLSNFCKEVENDFIGVKCGIMDQFSVALGKANNAILLNCATLKYDYVPIELGDYRLMIMNSKKPRSLIQSKYNERKHESEEALRIIQTSLPAIKHLCDAQMHHLPLLTDEILQRRARHVISENLRVKEAVKVLEMNDLTTFGRLMNASHASLKNDYEVSGIELDTLAETAQEVKGCLGARMTGGGFGGCAIALVHKTAIQTLIETVSSKYLAITGLHCEIYECGIGDGVRATN